MFNNTAFASAQALGVNSAWDFFQPYADFDVDFLYNALFCDNLSLFRRDRPLAEREPWCHVLDDPPSAQILQALAGDELQPSRLRALACHRLRTIGHAMEGPLLLGIVVELPHAQSQETLAAYADGRVHFIRHSGATASFDGDAENVSKRARKLVGAAQRMAGQFNAAQPRRDAPPAGGNVRITLLTGTGLFSVEGRFNALQKDPFAGPVLGNAIWLLQAHAQQG